jgi:hypothetical protein
MDGIVKARIDEIAEAPSNDERRKWYPETDREEGGECDFFRSCYRKSFTSQPGARKRRDSTVVRRGHVGSHAQLLIQINDCYVRKHIQRRGAPYTEF